MRDNVIIVTEEPCLYVLRPLSGFESGAERFKPISGLKGNEQLPRFSERGVIPLAADEPGRALA